LEFLREDAERRVVLGHGRRVSRKHGSQRQPRLLYALSVSELGRAVRG
jgi:hypothetical protein